MEMAGRKGVCKWPEAWNILALDQSKGQKAGHVVVELMCPSLQGSYCRFIDGSKLCYRLLVVRYYEFLAEQDIQRTLMPQSLSSDVRL